LASRIGSARKWHETMRPDLLRVTSPASDKTSRCFITAGSDIAKGFANSLTEIASVWLSRATSARRVGSASAEKVRSSGEGEQ
jgi:hypothetical protein